MDSTMHRMRIVTLNEGTETVEWNGQPEDAQAARVRFEEAMETNLYLAYAVIESEGVKQQVREFDPEATEINLVPKLVGG